MMTENRIGKKINQFRKEKKLTIKEFSDLSGISTALVSQLERGIGNPTLSVLRRGTRRFPCRRCFLKRLTMRR